MKQKIEVTIKRVKKRSQIKSKRIESKLHEQKMKTKQLQKAKHETKQLHEIENLSHQKLFVRQFQFFKLSIFLMIKLMTINLIILNSITMIFKHRKTKTK